MKNYNITQLHPEQTFERHVFHRDQFAHYLRWTHVLKLAKLNSKVLDFGCGNGNLYEVFYRNRYDPTYLGLDIRKQTIDQNREKFAKARWEVEDLVNMGTDYGTDWDFIASFEVAERVGKQNVEKFLSNIKRHCNPQTTVLISTPCYDEKVGAADNHTYDSGDGRGVAPQELTFYELKELIEGFFVIEKMFGTFASQKDYKPTLNEWQQKMFDGLQEYYDSNLVAVMMAPFFPSQSRNCLWRLRSK